MGNEISSLLFPIFSESVFSLSDGAIRFVVEKSSYILKLEDNLEDLEIAARRLEARRADMQRRTEIAERQGLQLLEEFRVRLLEVEEIADQVCSLIAAKPNEIERLCMYGFCSKSCMLTYSYGKAVFEKLETVNGILSSEEIEVVAIEGLPPDIEEGPTQPTVGLENMLEATWKSLMDDRVGILGLYGMGGVGKTTLLDQINNKFLEIRNEFHVVMSVVVSQDLQIGTIQIEIGKRLGLYNMEWEQKTKNEKAYDIYGVLTRKRFAVLLDDIWSKVDLKDIGIPVPSKANRSKVVFTTRSIKVCGRMGTNVEMEVKCLEPENAWKLFQQKVRATTLARDQQITKLAKIVCGKCKGLPLALKVIGETMACKTTVREWQHAIDILDSYAAEYPEVEEEILKVLKFSYDDLKNETVQQCFQYCALLPEDHKIDTNMLVDYWICEGIINGRGDREQALNKGHDIIGILVNACLLISLEFGAKVIMHDVVRQMAQWIASDFGKEKDNFVVKTGAGLHHLPQVEDSNAVRRMSLGNNEIQNISITQGYPNLTTLFLQQNKLVNIAGESFLSMPKLVVLDLSWNSCLNKLPEEVSKLVALRYLGLAGTALKGVTDGIKKVDTTETTGFGSHGSSSKH